MANVDLFASVLPTIEVDIFECERYQPGSGWSAQTSYRARECSLHWSSLKEVDEALLAPGWAWDQVPWQYEAQACAGADGWAYGTTFTPSFEGHPEPGQFSLVRWRRMSRLQSFAGSAVFLKAVGASLTGALGCPNVDLETAGKIGRQLLEALAEASVKGGEWSQPALVKLKKQLVECLQNASPERSVESVLSEFVTAHSGVIARARASWLGAPSPAPKEAAPTERRGSFAGALVGLAGSLADGLSAAAAERLDALGPLFPSAEREVLASFVMRRFCPELTCEVMGPRRRSNSVTSNSCEESEEGPPMVHVPSHDCPFRPVLCPHSGCCERVSARRLEAHESHCKFKPVPCPLCTEEVLRGQLASHVASACPEREAQCPFSSIGCQLTLTQRKVEEHLEGCGTSHLLLFLGALQEQKDMLRVLIRAQAAQQENREKEREQERETLRNLAREVAEFGKRIDRLEEQQQGDHNSLKTKLGKLESLVGAEAFRRAING